MTASNIVLLTTVMTQSVASVSPCVLLHAGGLWTPPETRLGSAVCSQGNRAAILTYPVGPAAAKLSSNWRSETPAPCNGTRQGFDAPDLST
jgi:hypothetical protein